MIRLAKAEKPDILVQNENPWTDEYLALRAEGRRDPTIEGRYRHPEIKNRLIDETEDKCAYCEQKLRASQFGDVEHIQPKSVYPHLFVLWSNLTLGCTVCNTFKGDREGFLDPYSTDPSDHLRFFGPMVGYAPGDLLGRQTERGLRLNRPELISKRTERLAQVQDTLDLYDATPVGAVKDILAEEIRAAAAPDKEFSAVVRQYMIDLGYGAILE